LPKRTKTPQEILSRYELDEVDKKILRLKLEYPSMSHSEIGTIVGLNRKAVAVRINKSAWQEAFNDFHTPAKSLLEKEADRLTRKYLKLCDSIDQKVAERATRAVLVSLGILKNKVEVGDFKFEPLVIEFESTGRRVVHTDEIKNLPPGIEVKDD
jgi:hypothetical protein